jgi:hypothetical protein
MDCLSSLRQANDPNPNRGAHKCAKLRRSNSCAEGASAIVSFYPAPANLELVKFGQLASDLGMTAPRVVNANRHLLIRDRRLWKRKQISSPLALAAHASRMGVTAIHPSRCEVTGDIRISCVTPAANASVLPSPPTRLQTGGSPAWTTSLRKAGSAYRLENASSVRMVRKSGSRCA